MKQIITAVLLLVLASCSKSNQDVCKHVTSIWQVPETTGVRNDTIFSNLLMCNSDLKDAEADNGHQYDYYVKKDGGVKHITILNIVNP